ncbi:restriction endonuclease subunit S [Roseibaca calidilacus]|nr:restriction endonuclease subunit S [Roseibaca calidilacus]
MSGFVTLGDITTLITKGTTPSAKLGGFSMSGVNFIKSESLKYDGSIDVTKFVFISEETNKKLQRSILRPNDILLSIAGANLGKCGLVTPQMLPANTNQAVAILRLDETKADPRFVQFFLRNPQFVANNLAGVAQSAQPNLNLGDIAKFRIPDWPLPEQREIAGILGALDDKIELNRRMAATLEEMARSLYRSWFVDFDPVHAKAAGHPPAHMDKTTAALFPDRFGGDGLPEGWVREGLLQQAEWVNGAAYKNMHFSNHPDALPVVKIAELKAGITGNTKFTTTDLGEKFRICRGELLFSWSGNPDTSIDAFIWHLGDAWLNQHIFVVRPNGKMSKAMLFSCLRFFNPEMAEIARNKQTTGLGHITRKDLEAFPVCVASQSVVRSFEDKIQPLFDRYCDCLYQNQTLATLRDSLLPRLMSGELRVGAARELIGDVA